MRSNRSRPRKAPGMIDTDFERKGRNGTDAGNRHQTPTNRIMLDHSTCRSTLPLVALEDRPPYVEHGFDGHRENRIATFEQLANACFVGTSSDGSNQ